MLSLRGRPLPYLRLRDHFRCAGEPPERENVLVLRYYDQQVGLVVDRLLGESQTVIKPLGRVLGDVPGAVGLGHPGLGPRGADSRSGHAAARGAEGRSCSVTWDTPGASGCSRS